MLLQMDNLSTVSFECTKIDHSNYVMYESGGNYGRIGYAFIICDKYGKPKKPFSISNVINGKHASIFVKIGDVICTCSINRKGKKLDIVFYSIISLNDNTASCVIKEVSNRSFVDVRRIAILKASTLYCRNPMYVDMN